MRKILDFGIAKQIAGGTADESENLGGRAGMVMGTPHYMSPEQAMGRAYRPAHRHLLPLASSCTRCSDGQPGVRRRSRRWLSCSAILRGEPAALRTLRSGVCRRSVESHRQPLRS